MADHLYMKNKDGKRIQVSRAQVAAFESQGWKLTDPPTPKVEKGPQKEPLVIGPDQALMFKGDKSCIADARQIPSLRKDGWSAADDKKEASNGREQDSGRPLDPAQGGDASAEPRKQPKRQ